MSKLGETPELATAVQGRLLSSEERGAPPRWRQCLAVSLLERRRWLLKSAATRKQWDATVAANARELVRLSFMLRADLLWVDLFDDGGLHAVGRQEVREATEVVVRASRALLVVSGSQPTGDEETWARSLGAWAYLPDAAAGQHMETVFADVRVALHRQAQRLTDKQSLWRGG